MTDTNAEPRKLSSFHNLHQGETIVVCGCGESLNELTQPERFVTIGVNDVGRRFQPNYLVVVNPRNQFSGDRFSYVESSRAEYLFTQLNLGLSRGNIVKFRLGTYAGTGFSSPDVLHHTQNSPYVALCLAVHMGAKRIGLIGVDFTEHHFFAQTGAHSLTPQLSIIDEQYKRLGEAISARGVEIFNLSRGSRLTAFPKLSLHEFSSLEKSAPLQTPPTIELPKEQPAAKRIFFVNYKFLSCGEVFTDGLRNAAKSLGIPFQEAYWDDDKLPAKVRDFKPDWLFVVHGRRFVQRWRKSFPNVKKAVWLLDEPYEVDDTSQWSSVFDVVFLNDPSTLHCHRNAHYLPVAYDSEVHLENGNTKQYQVGFIGGSNETRERYLLALLNAGLLSYVVGGPWRAPELRRVCLAANIPARETAELYRQTRVVVNLFRDVHHFNRRRIQAYSMNPRIYEALACGAVVVSETRGEVPAVFPELELFDHESQLVDNVRKLLADDAAYRIVKRASQERVVAHSYRERLLSALDYLDCPAPSPVNEVKVSSMEVGMENSKQQGPSVSVAGWVPCGQAAEMSDDDCIVLSKSSDDGPGTEQGLASNESFQDVELSFEVKLEGDACFIAKLHQASQFDQRTNSYHLFCDPGHTYLARHSHVFQNVPVKRDEWQSVRFKRLGNRIELTVDGTVVASKVDGALARGYCFLGVKRGRAQLRNLELNRTPPLNELGVAHKAVPDYEVLHSVRGRETPTVSIITTVYDRMDCLEDCLRSVSHLQYRDFEQIVVSDHPPDTIVDRIKDLVETASGSISYANLNARFNNWGIAPASVGLHLARGRYVCFLSDDNGYTPDHLGPLVEALERESAISFAYSSCQYAGRHVLRGATPRPGGIDLGQPLFRKEIFDRYMPGLLPFDMMAWDWHMIEAFMRRGLRWRHIDRPSFLFRLTACRQWARV
jgi:hypothetical protein